MLRGYGEVRRLWSAVLLPLFWFCLSETSVFAEGAPKREEPIPHNQDRAPNPARTPDEAVKAMTVPPGFHVEVVASEPDIVNPVAMTFDERGRIWITESLEYPRREPGPGRDRVKVLEDTDGDGKADRFTVFAEGLNIPSGIAVGHGGVWVANAPDILFLRDTDGDGKADVKEVVATGFGRHDTHELPNSLTWGPDGRLYGWNGVFNPSKVTSRNGKTYSFTCAIFRIDPRSRVFDLFCEGTSNPWGIAIDPEGSFFASACVIDHLWHLVETGYYIRQGGPYPPFTWPLKSIVDHLHQKAAYCGIHYFDSPAYPAEYRGRLYMGNIHGNCVNVDTLSRRGSSYQAKAAPDFLTANDSWFMPVVQKTGPDGCLYILDWYDRYHCYQDANRDPGGIDRLKGRLYRVRYGTTPRRVGFDLAKQDDDGLLKLLASENVYDRDIAQRLLAERSSGSIRSRLEALVLDDNASRKARMHGLWALLGAGRLTPEFHGKLLSHDDPSLRAWGVRAAGNQRVLDPLIRDRAVGLAGDASADVRLQVAIAARKIEGVEPIPLLLEVLSASGDDPVIPQIVWQNLHPLLEEQGEKFAALAGNADGKALGALSPILPRVIDRLASARAPRFKELAVLLRRSIDAPDRQAAMEGIEILTRRLQDRGLSAPLAEELKREIRAVLTPLVNDGRHAQLKSEILLLLAYCGDPEGLKTARGLVLSAAETNEIRLKALQVLLFNGEKERLHSAVAQLLSAPAGNRSSSFQGKVLESLGARDDQEIAEIVLKAYPGLEAETQPRAIELLSQRPAWSKALVAAVVRKDVPASALNVNQLRRLQSLKDPAVAAQVKAIWGTIRAGRNPKREQVVARMRNLVRKTPGDPFLGQVVFRKVCAQCHKIYGDGQDVGPEITLNGRNDFEQLLSNIFDPSLVIGPAYQATTVATTDGRILTGLLAEDSADRIVLKLQGGKVEVIPRVGVEEIKTGVLSLMPEDLETQLTPQEIVDLLAFLSLDKPPADSNARQLPGAGPIERRAKSSP